MLHPALWIPLVAAAHAQPQPVAEPSVAPVTDVTETLPSPVVGLADLHLHQWAELSYAGRWYFGDAAGPAPMALSECGDISDRPKPPKQRHGTFTDILGPGFGLLGSKLGMRDERSDDVRPRHPSPGASNWDQYPNWLGWPTSDSVAHQQIWEGWIRLAHNGVPVLYFLSQNPQISSIEKGLERFYADYEANMDAAAKEGAVGVNLIVVSLVHNNLACRQQVDKRALRGNPGLCNDMDAVKKQYDAAIYWANENADWAQIVTNPQEARSVIAQGKLAVVLSMEVADILGPSESIGDGRFVDGYIGAAKLIATSDDPSDDDIRQAIDNYLDTMPAISTIQLTHQLDSSFAGAAYIVNTFVQHQKWRDSHGKVEGQQKCAKVARDWKWKGDESVHYAECLASATQTPGRTALSSTLARLFQSSPPKPFRIPRKYERAAKEHDPHVYHNPYGLSSHGELLVDVMRRRGMVIDTSHLSRSGMKGLVNYLETVENIEDSPPTPLLISHTYPNEISVLQREQNVDRESLAMLEDRGTMVGVRPGDDWPELAKVDGPFADVLKSHDCTGTSVAAALFLEEVGKSGVDVTWGTDLNGFINQPSPTQMVRPPTTQRAACSERVPSIGSEVGQRGLAHIGLLPQMQMEAIATVPGSEQRRAMQSALNSAPAYIELWEQAWCAQPDVSCPEPGPSAEAKAPWANWRSWVFNGDELATIKMRLPIAGGTVPPFQARSEGRVPPQPWWAETEVPRWRAIEAVLPYQSRFDRSPKDHIAALPQLPTSIGLLVGMYSYGVQAERQFFPYKRCVWSGNLSRSQRKQRREDCQPVKEARRRYQKNAHAKPRVRRAAHKPMDKWHRMYAGKTRGEPRDEDKRSFEQQLRTIVEESPNAMYFDFPTFEPVAQALLEKPECLTTRSTVLMAAPPGLPTGSDPALWLQHQDRRKIDRTCYCHVLGTVKVETPRRLLSRDQQGIAFCKREGLLPKEL